MWVVYCTIWEEISIHMIASDPWYSFHEIWYSYISLYLAFGKLNWKLGTLHWNWEIVCAFKPLFLVKDECTSIWYVIGDLIILAIPRLTSQFKWVELASFVSYLMDSVWEESYIHMNVSDPFYYFHELQYSYISFYFAFGKLNWKLGTLWWNW